MDIMNEVRRAVAEGTDRFYIRLYESTHEKILESELEDQPTQNKDRELHWREKNIWQPAN